MSANADLTIHVRHTSVDVAIERARGVLDGLHADMQRRFASDVLADRGSIDPDDLDAILADNLAEFEATRDRFLAALRAELQAWPR